MTTQKKLLARKGLFLLGAKAPAPSSAVGRGPATPWELLQCPGPLSLFLPAEQQQVGLQGGSQAPRIPCLDLQGWHCSAVVPARCQPCPCPAELQLSSERDGCEGIRSHREFPRSTSLPSVILEISRAPAGLGCPEPLDFPGICRGLAWVSLLPLLSALLQP